MSDLLAQIITTAPRPTETLTRSIKSWREAGFDERLNIFSDGVPEFELPALPMLRFMFHPDFRIGGLVSWVYALNQLLLISDARWLMVAEDDIVWTRNCKATLLAELEKADPKGIGYISLYAARAVTWRLQRGVTLGHLPPGYYESRLGWSTWGSQCLILPRASAIALLQNDAFRKFVQGHIKNKNRDAVVSKFLSDMRLRTMFRIPCLVNHIGAGNSAYGNAEKKALETDYFVEALP